MLNISWLSMYERGLLFGFIVLAVLITCASILPIQHSAVYRQKISCICAATAPITFPALLPKSWCTSPDLSQQKYYSSIEEPPGTELGSYHKGCRTVFELSKMALGILLAWSLLLVVARSRRKALDVR
jgi:hypothetical protein